MLILSLLLTTVGCFLKLPYPGDPNPVGNGRYYPGTLLIIFSSVLAEATIFNLLMTTISTIPSLAVVYTGTVLSFSSGVARIVTNLVVGGSSLVEDPDSRYVYSYAFLLIILGLLFLTLPCLYSTLKKADLRQAVMRGIVAEEQRKDKVRGKVLFEGTFKPVDLKVEQAYTQPVPVKNDLKVPLTPPRSARNSQHSNFLEGFGQKVFASKPKP